MNALLRRLDRVLGSVDEREFKIYRVRLSDPKLYAELKLDINDRQTWFICEEPQVMVSPDLTRFVRFRSASFKRPNRDSEQINFVKAAVTFVCARDLTLYFCDSYFGFQIFDREGLYVIKFDLETEEVDDDLRERIRSDPKYKIFND